MANPNIWAPGTAVNADSSIASQAFIASEGQTLFTLTQFSYYRETGSLYVFVSGLFQRLNIDFTETSQNSFTLNEGVPEGTVVAAVGFTEVTGGYEYVAEATEQADLAAAAAAAAALSEAAAALSEAAAATSESNAADSAVQSADSAVSSAASAAAAQSYASVGFDVASTIYDFGFITDASLTFTTDYGSVA